MVARQGLSNARSTSYDNGDVNVRRGKDRL